MKLQIGGFHRLDGWLNLDIMPGEAVDIVGDAAAIPLDAETCDEIYASHVLEHFSYWKVLDVLKEWRRVLKPGGFLRVSVPDLETLCRLYVEQTGAAERWKVMQVLYGGQGNQHDYHFCGWNWEQLAEFLKAAGFERVTKVSSLGVQIDCSLLEYCGVPISLNVICQAK